MFFGRDLKLFPKILQTITFQAQKQGYHTSKVYFISELSNKPMYKNMKMMEALQQTNFKTLQQVKRF